MRFRFCGGADCPDWLLAELHALSRLSSVRVRQLAGHVVQAMLSEDGKMDEEKLQKMVTDAKLDGSALKAGSSCIWFVLNSAARHGAQPGALASELLQLGLPREHGAALCKVYAEHGAAITNKLKERSLRVNRLGSLSCTIPENTVACVQLDLKINDTIVNGRQQNVEKKINISEDDLQIMINELKKAYALMEDL